MIFFLVVLLIVFLFGIKPQKDKANYLNRSITISITGFFALIIFCSHFWNYINVNDFSLIDKPLYFFTSYLGQLMVAPFLFFSGFGIVESYKAKGDAYTNTMPKNRLLKVFLMFFVAWVLYVCVALYFKTDYSIADYLLSIIGIRSIGNSNWYIVVIILLYFFSYLAFKLGKRSMRRVLLINLISSILLYALLVLISPGSWWYNTLLCYFFGMVYSALKSRIDSKLLEKKSNPLVFFACSVLLFVCFYLFDRVIKITLLNHLLYALTCFFFCLSIVLFLYIFQVKNKILLFLGTNCFWIYIIQRLPMIVLSHSSIISSNRYIYFCLCLALTLVLAFVLNKTFSFVWNIVFLRKMAVNENVNSRVGIVISYVSLAFSILGAFIVTPRLLEWLGDTQYGLRSFATSIATWLTVISTALAASYLRFINLSNKDRENDEGKTNCLYLKIFLIISLVILFITVVTSVVCFAFGVSFGNYTSEENKLIILLLLLSGINVSIQIASSVFTHYLTFKKEFIFIRGLTLVITFLTFALELFFVFVTKSVIAITFVTLALTIISSAISIFFAIKIKRMPFEKATFKDNSSVIRAIIIFSSFVLLNAVVDQINQQVDITILGFMTSAEKVTDYTLARYFTTYMASLSIAISSTYAPKVHELVKKADLNSLNDLFEKVSNLQLIILSLVVGGFASSGHSFMRIWLGESKEYIYYYSLVLLALNIIPLSCNLGIEVQRAMNKHKFRALLYIIFALLNVGISIFLIAILPNDMAIWGAIFGTVFSIGIGNSVVLNIYNHVIIKLNMIRYFARVLKFLVVTLIAVMPCVFLYHFLSNSLSNGTMFLINGFIFLLIYSVELLIIDRKTIVPMAKKILQKLR